MINLIQNYFTETNTALNYLILLRSFSTVDEFDRFYRNVYKTIVSRSSDISFLIPSLTEYQKMDHTQDDYITKLSTVNEKVAFLNSSRSIDRNGSDCLDCLVGKICRRALQLPLWVTVLNEPICTIGGTESLLAIRLVHAAASSSSIWSDGGIDFWCVVLERSLSNSTFYRGIAVARGEHWSKLKRRRSWRFCCWMYIPSRSGTEPFMERKICWRFLSDLMGQRWHTSLQSLMRFIVWCLV